MDHPLTFALWQSPAANATVALLTTGVFGMVGISQAVQETKKEFHCCNHTVTHTHDLSCDNMWSFNDMSIAQISTGSKDCISPCKEINRDRMILDKCVNRNGIVTKETKITYLVQTCPSRFSSGTPNANQGSAGFLLMAVMIGWLLLPIR